MPIFLIQRPSNFLIQGFQSELFRLSNVPKHAVNRLGFIVSFFALDNILRVHTALGKIDISFDTGG
jgi:hypothetical protein